MFKLKTFILCLATLFCVGLGTLGAQTHLGTINVGVVIDGTAKQHYNTVKYAFNKAIQNQGRFLITNFDEKINTQIVASIIKMHNPTYYSHQKDLELDGTVVPYFVFFAEVNKNEDDNIEVGCGFINLVSRRDFASDKVEIPYEFNKNYNTLIEEKCLNLMKGILNKLNTIPPEILFYPIKQQVGPNIFDDRFKRNVQNIFDSSRTVNPEWNKLPSKVVIIDPEFMDVKEDNTYGHTTYRVSGEMALRLSYLEKTGSVYHYKIKAFTESSKDRITGRVIDQIKSDHITIIAELLKNRDVER